MTVLAFLAVWFGSLAAIVAIRHWATRPLPPDDPDWDGLS